jgi:hypothetical protein
MSTPIHNQFTLLHEDGEMKLLYEFKSVVADEVIQHLVDFLKGCGYMESSIFECMKELADQYFDAMSTDQYLLNWNNETAE